MEKLAKKVLYIFITSFFLLFPFVCSDMRLWLYRFSLLIHVFNLKVLNTVLYPTELIKMYVLKFPSNLFWHFGSIFTISD